MKYDPVIKKCNFCGIIGLLEWCNGWNYYGCKPEHRVWKNNEQKCKTCDSNINNTCITFNSELRDIDYQNLCPKWELNTKKYRQYGKQILPITVNPNPYTEVL